MIEGIIGAVIAIIASVFGFLFHKRGDRIKELERSNTTKDKQIEIDEVNRELSKPIEKEERGEETTADMVNRFNNPSGGRV